MKPQTPIALQRKIFAANLVYQRDQLLETVRPVKVPQANLIFFGFEIFLAARHPRPVLQQLEGRSIDSVICAQGRGQDQACDKRRAAAGLQICVQDIRSVGPEIHAEKFPHRRLRKLGEKLRNFLLGIFPGEVSVRLRKAHFRETVHNLRTRERLSEKDHIRVGTMNFCDHPFPETEWLCVRIIHAKNPDALLNPVESNTLQLCA